MPRVGTYRGVGLFAFQSQKRIKSVVKPEIDRIHDITDPATLVAFAEDESHCPEARLLAHAKVEAAWILAAEGRMLRPAVDLDRLRAVTAGLDSRNWVDRGQHGSMFDGGRCVPRERPLTDADLER